MQSKWKASLKAVVNHKFRKVSNNKLTDYSRFNREILKTKTTLQKIISYTIFQENEISILFKGPKLSKTIIYYKIRQKGKN